MSNVKIIGPNVPNMPWQERPADNQTGLPLWRYNENPIIGRNPAPGVARILKKTRFLSKMKMEMTLCRFMHTIQDS